MIKPKLVIEPKPYLLASEFWDALSPTNSLFKEPCNLIYRGQADADWELLPSLLRNEGKNSILKFGQQKAKSDELIFNEMILLEKYAHYCDYAGVKVPNDSIRFREEVLNRNAIEKYLKMPRLWPHQDLIELMALAQHHGVPTRLLDWTRHSNISVYFAVSTALERYKETQSNKSIAVWVLDIERIKQYPSVKIVKVPGSISNNISAQSGVFTIHPHLGSTREDSFAIKGLEHEFSDIPDSPLKKLTLPVSQVEALYKLCKRAGINGATIYPSADGVGKAVTDEINLWNMNQNI